MPDLPIYSCPYRVADLPGRKAKQFLLEPDDATREAIAADLGIPGVRKLRFQGALSPAGKSDWLLTAELGATVVQNCVVTLEPVVTRLDTKVDRKFVRTLREPTEEEVEMPEDDTVDHLQEFIDVGLVMFEALALALPDYPRAENVTLENRYFTEPDQEAMTDEDAKPFASLAALRDKLGKGE